MRFFSRNDFDLLHAHLPYSQTVGRVLATILGPQTVVSTQHNVPDNYHPITRRLERITRPLDSATIAVSEGVEREFTGQSHRYDGELDGQWCTIYNGIDVEEFNDVVHHADRRVRERWDITASTIFLNVSRYVEAKSQKDLIAAMETIRAQGENAHLLIVGWGEKEESLRREVRDRDLEDYITITGKVPEIEPYYAVADAFVSSSIFEGLPTVHIEAMAAELPVIATDIPGVREIVIDGKTGRLVPPSKPNAIGEAMVDYLDSEMRSTDGQNGYKRARTEFNISHTVSAHMELYRELIQE